MTVTTINIGAVVNDGTGDAIRTAFDKVNTDILYLDSSNTFSSKLFNSNIFGGTTTLSVQDQVVLNTLTANDITGNTLVLEDSTDSIDTTSGALQVVGGAGIGGNLYVGGTIFGTIQGSLSVPNIDDTEIGLLIPRDAGFQSVTVNNQLSLTGGAHSGSVNTGDLVVDGGVGIAENLFVGARANIAGNTRTSGLQVDGRVYGSLRLFGSDQIFINGAAVQTTTSSFPGGNVQLQANFNAITSSIDPGSGAVVVKGGLGVAGNVNVGGYITAGSLNLNTTIGHLELGEADMFANGAIAGNLITSIQGNITQVGTLNGLTVAGVIYPQTAGVGKVGDTGTPFGSMTAGTFYGSLSGTVTQAAQTSITSLGTLTGLTVQGVSRLGDGTSSNTLVVGTTTSTSSTTGALVVKGGVGVAGNIYSGGTVSGAKVKVGSLNYPDTNVLAEFQNNNNGYNQVVLQNQNSGSSASADYIVNNDQSTASTYYGDFGMNSSNYSGAGSLALPNAVYLTATTGDLVLGTTTANTIRFIVNSGATDAVQIGTSGNLVVVTTTASTSTTTGALVVRGGVGIAGVLNIANTGDVSANIGSTQIWANANIAEIRANLGSTQIWANANIASLRANLGSTQIWANANIATINSNLGSFQTYANAKIGTNTNGNVMIASTDDVADGPGYALSGALMVAGGAGINKSLIVYGDVTIKGAIQATQSVSSTYSGLSIFNAGVIAANVKSADIGNIGTVLTGTLSSSSAAQTNVTSLGTLTGLKSSGNVVITSTDDVADGPGYALGGALMIAGGAGVNKSMIVYGDLTVKGSIVGSQTVSSSYSGLSIFNAGIISANVQSPDIGNIGTILTGTLGSTSAAQANITSLGILTGLTSSGNIVITASTPSTSATSGALVVPTGGVGIGGSLWLQNTGDVSANLGAYQISTSANLGSTQIWANANIASLRANLGSTQIWANANIQTINANLGSFQTWSNANASSLQNQITGANTNIQTTSANLGAYQTFANSSIQTTSANLGAYQTFANSSIQTTSANLGAYQTWSNANVSSLQNQITGANTNIQTTSANLGAFQAYANSKIGTNTNSNLVVASTDKSISQFTGALVVSGGVGVNGNINVASSGGNSVVASGAIVSTANAIVDLGTTALYWRNLYARTHVGDTFTIGGGGLTSAGNIVATAGTTSSNVATGALVIVGGAGISGVLNIGNTGDVSANIGAYQTFANANVSSLQNQITGANTNIQTTSANLGAYQTFANSNVSSLQNQITGANTNIQTTSANLGAFQAYANSKIGTNSGSNVVIQSSQATTSTTTGALVIPTGGVGIGGSVIINGTNSNLTLGYSSVTTATAGGNFAVAGNVGIGKSDPIAKFQVYTTNAIQTYFGASNAGTTPIQNQIMTQAKTAGGTGLEVYDQNGSDSTITPFVVSNNSGPALAKVNLLKVDGVGNVVITSTTTSTSTTTGALTVAGGVGIAGTLWLQNVGDLSANLGTVSLASGASATAFYTYANSKIGTNSGSNVVIGSSATSGNITSGALVVAGGVGIGGNTYISGNVVLGSGTTSNVVVAATTISTSTTTGALVVSGGAGISGNTYISGNVILGSGTTSNVVVAATTVSTSANTGALVVSGGVGISGNVFHSGWHIPGANLSYNLGSTTAWWNNVYGKAIQAQYADLAERYASDAEYPAGTVVVIGGDAEVTVTTIDHDPRAAGVVSTDPAYLMNASSTGLPIALTGRVPCRVIGPVNKGSLLVTSNISGVAQVMDPARYQPGCVIGKSLQTITDDGIHVIEIMVGRY